MKGKRKEKESSVFFSTRRHKDAKEHKGKGKDEERKWEGKVELHFSYVNYMSSLLDFGQFD